MGVVVVRHAALQISPAQYLTRRKPRPSPRHSFTLSASHSIRAGRRAARSGALHDALFGAHSAEAFAHPGLHGQTPCCSSGGSARRHYPVPHRARTVALGRSQWAAVRKKSRSCHDAVHLRLGDPTGFPATRHWGALPGARSSRRRVRRVLRGCWRRRTPAVAGRGRPRRPPRSFSPRSARLVTTVALVVEDLRLHGW